MCSGGARSLILYGRAVNRSDSDGDRWRRWTDRVHKRPWLSVLAGAAVLLALAAPALGLRLGFADAGNDPAGSTSRAATA